MYRDTSSVDCAPQNINMYNRVLKAAIFSASPNTILYSNSVFFHWGKINQNF